MPFRYLGVPISANTLSNLESSMLADKITKRIRVWATKTTTYQGRVTLTNSVLMGIFNFRANIFIILQGMIREVEKLCRNYLWGADDTYKKVPFVARDDVCKPKKHGGLGLKNMEAWNQACIAKLVWAVAKKEILWVKWVHMRHIRGGVLVGLHS